ncbi:MAG: tRNA 2-selenouridine(34) synthase MnmH [Bacteroidota bacterium]
MSITKIDLPQFLLLKQHICVVDVRSISEYNHAHVPNAFSLPIFNDEERKVIGTAYKQESREKAIRIGLDFFGKKLLQLVDAAELITKTYNNANRELIVHCWRGGMRSAAMAWLLDLYGFKVYLLNGGYKTFRHWTLAQFDKAYPLHVIAGFTGSNKTGLLTTLLSHHQNVVDLEALAKHRGSTFGNLNEHAQPSQEQFENLLAENLSVVEENGKTIWIEGESQRIGLVNIPKNFYLKMLMASTTQLEIPFEERLKHILSEYGEYDEDKIEKAILRITKKLGGLETKQAIQFLRENNLKECYAIILKYYDRLYRKSALSSKTNQNAIRTVECNSTDATTNAQTLLQYESR